MQITASIPAKETAAVAAIGVRMDTSELEKERMPLAFW